MQTFCFIEFLLFILAMLDRAISISGMCNYSTSGNERVSACITWIEECMYMLPIHGTFLIRHDEACHRDMVWRFYRLHGHRSKAAPIFWQNLHDLQKLKPSPFRNKICISYREGEMVRYDYWWRRIPAGPMQHRIITKCGRPITVSELCHSTRCCRLVSYCIPDFHINVRPLNEILEKAYTKAKKQKKKALKNNALHTLSGGTEYVTVFAFLQDSLRTAVKLA